MKKGLTGLGVVLKNLNKEAKEIERKTLTGLIKGGMIVRSEGQRITPVNTGNLVNSWYGPEPLPGKSPTVEIGLTADYAVYVHENVGAHFRKPGAQAKFLEAPLKENADEILAILKREVQIK